MQTSFLKIFFYSLVTWFLLLISFSDEIFPQTTLTETPIQIQIQKCWESNSYNYGSDNPLFLPSRYFKSKNFDFVDHPNSFLSFNDGSLKLIDTKTGNENWQTETGGELATEPFMQDEGIYIVIKPLPNNLLETSEPRKTHYSLRFINKETGITEWTRIFSHEGNIYLYALKGIAFLINPESQISAFDQQNGNILWKKSYPGKLFSAPFFFDDKAVFPKDDGISLISLTEGRVIFHEKGINYKLKSLTSNGEMIFFGDEKGFLHGLKIGSRKRRWKYRLGGAISSVSYQEGYILVTSLDNFVYYFSVANGKLIWKKRVAGRIINGPLIFNRNALILVEGSSTTLFLDLSDGKIVNQITFPEETIFAGNPKKVNEVLVIPTQKNIIAYSFGQCP